MTPESAEHLSKARETVGDAGKILSALLPNVAARLAYMAAFQAAQAYVFERTGMVAKTHNGVQSEFGRLAQEDGRIGTELMVFLRRAYDYKRNDDYAVGAAFRRVSQEEAEGAVRQAARFVDTIAATLSSSHPK